MVLGDDQTPESIRIIIKGIFVEVMPSPNNVARDRSFLQRHFCNVILIRRIIFIFRFGHSVLTYSIRVGKDFCEQLCV